MGEDRDCQRARARGSGKEADAVSHPLAPFDDIKRWKLFDGETGVWIWHARFASTSFPDFGNWKDHDSYQTASAAGEGLEVARCRSEIRSGEGLSGRGKIRVLSPRLAPDRRTRTWASGQPLRAIRFRTGTLLHFVPYVRNSIFTKFQGIREFGQAPPEACHDSLRYQ